MLTLDEQTDEEEQEGVQLPAAIKAHKEEPYIVDVSSVVAIVEEQIEALDKFLSGNLQDGVHYGVPDGFPSGTKPFLYKAGAERLCLLYGMAPEFSVKEKVLDWEKPLFYFQYECRLLSRKTGVFLGSAIGSCNSHETKYRWRESRHTCPACGSSAVRASKKDDGWFCWRKIGGCGKNFVPNDPTIVAQKVGREENLDVAEQLNTIEKMAQKRALVAAVLVAVGLSGIFAQDEDLVADQRFAPSGSAIPPQSDIVVDEMPPDVDEKISYLAKEQGLEGALAALSRRKCGSSDARNLSPHDKLSILSQLRSGTKDLKT